MLQPVILSGGSGTRLWPLSRELYPKQLLALQGERTMLQETLARLSGMDDTADPLVVCNENHRFMVAEQMREQGIAPKAIILEPVGRNTAPAVAVAALSASGAGDDPVLLVLPADHGVSRPELFRAAVSAGLPLAEAGRLITFGVVPTGPETGYGYIRRGEPIGEDAFAVDSFVEKPDLARANAFVDSGEYYWNSGIFMFRASRYLEELERFAPGILAACREAVAGAAPDLDFVRLDKAAFAACPSDSVDYAVMERVTGAVVVPMNAGWSDLGSWSALCEACEQDAQGNALVGDVLAVDSKGCYLRAESRLLAAAGLTDIIAVETSDAVLVTTRERVQDVKKLVDVLKSSKREEAYAHRKMYRPWGSYERVDLGQRFQVKRIVVNPGATLSLQSHHHRAEHWVVVTGTARVTRGEQVTLLKEDQSVYIPLGTVHRLENPGRIPLELIEVQTGAYLGEDDIVRFEDVYGREGRKD